jgi:integrase
MTFELWLQRAGYRESTRRATVRQIATMRAALEQGAAPEPYLGPAIRRYLAWTASEGLQGPERCALEELGYRPVAPATAPRERRKLPRRSFTDDDWYELLQALSEDETPEGTVLRVMAVTSLRVGDVLAIPWRHIDEGLPGGVITVERKGGRYLEVPTAGSEVQWAALATLMSAAGYTGDIVASYVRGEADASPLAGEAAYQRVNRYLKGLGAELALPEPVHLHRLRRTLAVQALRTTKDMNLVQQLLGHVSMSSTERYVDEVRTDDVGRLQAKLGQYRKPRP